MVISTEIEICLVMINVLDGVVVIAVAMHQLRASLTQPEETHSAIIASHTHQISFLRKTYRILHVRGHTIVAALTAKSASNLYSSSSCFPPSKDLNTTT